MFPMSTDSSTHDTAPTSDDLDVVGVLAEPTRRALYDYVVSRHDWVGRDAAAQALGLRRGVTVHHLDRLEAEGLLVSDHRRLNGRSGPGAGRPAKVYRRAPQAFAVSFPPRRYDLAGQVLAAAADRARSEGVPIDDAIESAARDQGRRVGEGARRRAGDRTDPEVRRRALFEELRDDGFEPVTGDDGVTRLANCPFHDLSTTHTDLICGMNHVMLRAAVARCGGTDLDARLEPETGQCCVRFHRVAHRRGADDPESAARPGVLR